MSRKREWGVVAGLFVAALIVSAVFWSLLPAEYRENQSSDYTNAYEPVARAIAAGQGITLDGELATRYPPGFSLLLALTLRIGNNLGLNDAAAILAFRLLCVGLSVVLVYALARLVWSPGLALLPALAWMTYPFFLWLTKQPNSEVAFIPALLAALYLFWRPALRGGRGLRAWIAYGAAGLLVGAAMLIRPAALGLSVVLALVLLLWAAPGVGRRARLGHGALIVLGSLLAVLPWEAAVYAQSGEIIPLSSGGAMTIHDGLTFLAVPKDYRREVAVPEDVAALMWTIHERRRETVTPGGLISVVSEEARRAPGAFAKLLLIKVARSWYGIDSRILETPTLLLQAVYLALSLWGSLYAWRQGGALRRMVAGNWLIVLYFWGMTLLVVPLLRYLVPVMSLLMLPLPGVYLSLAARRGWAKKELATDFTD
jgi:4-amino-4-deoxy-L-arabinose transferase-like glycosyltransferase